MLFDERVVEEAHAALIEAGNPGSKLLGVIGASANVTLCAAMNQKKEYGFAAFVVVELGVRLRNCAGATAKLATAGYFAPAGSQMRDIAETGQLLDLFAVAPTEIERWGKLHGRKRYEKFGFGTVKKRLKDEGVSTRWPERFDFYSEYGTHVSSRSFGAMHSDSSMQVGPHPDTEKFTGTIVALAQDVSAATCSFISAMEAENPRMVFAREHPAEFQMFRSALAVLAEMYPNAPTA
jgi:hypothetical protein